MTTFELEDIFLKGMASVLRNTSMFRLVQINTTAFGRCYSVRPTEPTVGKWSARFYLKRNIDQKIFLHEEGDEKWLTVFDIPFTTKPIVIKVNGEFQFSLLSFKVFDAIAFPTDQRKCINYVERSNFWQCFGRNFSDSLSQKITCKIPGNDFL